MFRLRLDFDFLIPDVVDFVWPQRLDPDDHVVYLLVGQFAVPCRHSSIGATCPNHSFQRFRGVMPGMRAAIEGRWGIPPVGSGISPPGSGFAIGAMAACAIFAVDRLASLDFFRVKLARRQIFWRLYRCRGRRRCFRGHSWPGCGWSGESRRGLGWRGRNRRRLRCWRRLGRDRCRRF